MVQGQLPKSTLEPNGGLERSGNHPYIHPSWTTEAPINNSHDIFKDYLRRSPLSVVVAGRLAGWLLNWSHLITAANKPALPRTRPRRTERWRHGADEKYKVEYGTVGNSSQD